MKSEERVPNEHIPANSTCLSLLSLGKWMQQYKLLFVLNRNEFVILKIEVNLLIERNLISKLNNQ